MKPLFVRSDILAQILSLSQRRIGQLARESGAEHQGGKVDAGPIVATYVRRLREKAGVDDLAGARTRLTAAQAEKHEIDARERKQELISISVVREELGRLISDTRNTLLGVPSKVAAVSEGKTAAEIHAIVDGAIREALTDLADGKIGTAPKRRRRG